MRYRFGFNGKENDNEVKGTGNQIDFGSRIYDPRLGRWLSLDPLAKKYPSESPYNFAGNSPISIMDPDGKRKTYYIYQLNTDGSLSLVATIVDKDQVIKSVKKTTESYNNSPLAIEKSETVTNDVFEVFIVDVNGKKVHRSGEQKGAERSNSEFIGDMEDFASEHGPTGGYFFVRRGAGSQGGESRKGDGTSEIIDITELMDVLEMAMAAAKAGQAVDKLVQLKDKLDVMVEGFKYLDKFGQKIKAQDKKMSEIAEERKKRQNVDSTYCGTCKENVSNKDTSRHYLNPEK